MGTGRASRAPRLGLTRRGGHRPGSCHGHGATDAQASTLKLEPTSQGPPSSAWPPASAASPGLGSPRGQITDARLHRGLTAGAPSAPSPLSALPRPAGAQGTASSAVSCACGNGSFLPRGACHCVSLQKCMLPCRGITHHVHTVTCQADPTAMCNRKEGLWPHPRPPVLDQDPHGLQAGWSQREEPSVGTFSPQPFTYPLARQRF